ncbi:MAG TPA: PLDc N-terminal domain-containing protein [Candidatus Pacearchaeota archaeon]|nr:PLDc N-terminal domain-containing protein [Candidatus Pacearchaeota archaeon]HOR52494.1 PLDc N-terminal domain-containing protein [Candidatus Pacearchaeota archaeon]HOU79351.1 PLDc N-terminal domain-containing protein [Candidatus Pacearchaeota archaeon]HPJ86882.1 PLDc N-terminal domain-containing protein [Candidatus Pacearchaeota archaeon]HQF82867.1 PLDc N-terminal domain-containing protein [Candidatus Pacearchaeota archaeon]
MALGIGGTLVGIVALICAVWIIYDVWANQKKMSSGYKILWTVAAIVFSIFTAIVYYFVNRK